MVYHALFQSIHSSRYRNTESNEGGMHGTAENSESFPRQARHLSPTVRHAKERVPPPLLGAPPVLSTCPYGFRYGHAPYPLPSFVLPPIIPPYCSEISIFRLLLPRLLHVVSLLLLPFDNDAMRALPPQRKRQTSKKSRPPLVQEKNPKLSPNPPPLRRSLANPPSLNNHS